MGRHVAGQEPRKLDPPDRVLDHECWWISVNASSDTEEGEAIQYIDPANPDDTGGCGNEAAALAAARPEPTTTGTS